VKVSPAEAPPPEQPAPSIIIQSRPVLRDLTRAPNRSKQQQQYVLMFVMLLIPEMKFFLLDFAVDFVRLILQRK